MFTYPHAKALKETAPEKVLRLALSLPQTKDELEQEADRIETLLENLSQPSTSVGEELQCHLADAMEYLCLLYTSPSPRDS